MHVYMAYNISVFIPFRFVNQKAMHYIGYSIRLICRTYQTSKSPSCTLSFITLPHAHPQLLIHISNLSVNRILEID